MVPVTVGSWEGVIGGNGVPVTTSVLVVVIMGMSVSVVVGEIVVWGV